MQHIITDEEVKRACHTWRTNTGDIEVLFPLILRDFLNNRPQVAQLRPIAEMSEKPPEGCKRITIGLNQHGNINNMCANGHTSSGCSLFVDLVFPTPDPEAEERRQFEEAMKKEMPAAHFKRLPTGEYEYSGIESFWFGWKLAKKGGDK